MSVDVAKLVSRADTQLARLEQQKLQEFLTALRKSQEIMTNEFARRWPDDKELTQGGAIGRARAAVLLQESGALVDLIESRLDTQSTATAQSIIDARQLGVDGALEALSAFDPSHYDRALEALSVHGDINVRAATQAILGMESNLTNWSKEFISAAQNSVIQSIVSGEHSSSMARKLAADMSTTRYKAERVLRTELHQAEDRARREVYYESGILYVQRVATEDDRVCFWCMDRAGNIYKIEEAPASLHPFDRCFNMPWSPVWDELGLIDNEWINEHKNGVEAKYNEQVAARRAAGQKVTEPAHGSAAPFDIGRVAPVAVWTPRTGYETPREELIERVLTHLQLPIGRDPLPPEEPGTPPTPGTPPAAPTEPDPRIEGFLHDKEANEALLASSFMSTLTEEERALVTKYQSLDFRQVNDFLLGKVDTLEGWTQEEVDGLRRLLNTHQIPHDVVAYRYLTLPRDWAPENADALVGTLLENPNFVSTSVRKDLMDVISQSSFAPEGEVRVVVVIRIPEGARGLYLSESGEWTEDFEQWMEQLMMDKDGSGMYELVLPPGSDFLITDAEWVGRNKIELHVDLAQRPIEVAVDSEVVEPTVTSTLAKNVYTRDELIEKAMEDPVSFRVLETSNAALDDMRPHERSNYLREKYGLTITPGEASSVVEKEITVALDNMLTMFPGTEKLLEGVTYERAKEGYAFVQASPMYFGPDGERILGISADEDTLQLFSTHLVFNDRHLSDPERFGKSLRNNMRTGFQPYLTAEGLTVHEFGHILDAHIQSYGQELDFDIERLRNRLLDELNDAIKVSDYAGTDDRELFAETFLHTIVMPREEWGEAEELMFQYLSDVAPGLGWDLSPLASVPVPITEPVPPPPPPVVPEPVVEVQTQSFFDSWTVSDRDSLDELLEAHHTQNPLPDDFAEAIHTHTLYPEALEDHDLVDVAQSALESRVIPTDALLYRGLVIEDMDGVDDPAKLVGTILPQEGIASTTLYKETSFEYMGIGTMDFENDPSVSEFTPVLVEIHAKGGETRGLYAEPLAANKGDTEFLLPGGSDFKIVEAEWVTEAAPAGLDMSGDGTVRYLRLRVEVEPTTPFTTEVVQPVATVVTTTTREPQPNPVSQSEVETREPAATVRTSYNPEIDVNTFVVNFEQPRKEQALESLPGDLLMAFNQAYRVKSKEDVDVTTWPEWQLVRTGTETQKEEAYNRIAEELSRRSGIDIPSFSNLATTVEQYYKPAMDFIANPENSALVIRAPGDAAVQILEDRRFKSQFETNRSGGLFAPEFRAEAEAHLFGDGAFASVYNRPIYGYLSNPGLVNDDKFWTEQYGGVAFELKASTRSNTTFTGGDSLDAVEHHPQVWRTPAPINAPEFSAFSQYAAIDRIVKGEAVPSAPTNLQNITSTFLLNFLEIQVHGGVHVSDIERIHVDSSKVTPAAVKKIQRLAKQLKIKVVIK